MYSSGEAKKKLQSKGGEKTVKRNTEMTKIMEFAVKDLKAIIINMLKDLKDNMNIMKKECKKEPRGNYRHEKCNS